MKKLSLVFCLSFSFAIIDTGSTNLVVGQTQNAKAKAMVLEAFRQISNQQLSKKTKIFFVKDKKPFREIHVELNQDYSACRLYFEDNPSFENNRPRLEIEQVFDGKTSLRQQKTTRKTRARGVSKQTLFFAVDAGKNTFGQSPFFGAGFLFDVDENSGKRWSKQLADGKIGDVVTKEKIVACKLISPDSTLKWSIQITSSKNPRLVRVEYHYKLPDNAQQTDHFRSGILNQFKFSDDGQLKSFAEYSKIKSRNKNGPYFHESKVIRTVDSRKSITQFSLSLSDFHKLDKIENGTQVFVKGQEGIRHVFEEGKIKKVIDESALNNLKKINPAAVYFDPGKVSAQDYLRSKDSGAHCGLYCVLTASAILQREVDVSKLFDEKFLSGPFGSSSIDIQEALKTVGLKSYFKSSADISDIRNWSEPVLIRKRPINC